MSPALRRSPLFIIAVLIVCLIVIGGICSAGLTMLGNLAVPARSVVPTVAIVPTVAVVPTPFLDIRTVVHIVANPPITQQGDTLSVTAQVTNSDKIGHNVRLQANFYSVTTDQLGDDPAQYLLTAGYVDVTLSPGTTRVTITAKDVLPDPVKGVDFSIDGH